MLPHALAIWLYKHCCINGACLHGVQNGVSASLAQDYVCDPVRRPNAGSFLPLHSALAILALITDYFLKSDLARFYFAGEMDCLLFTICWFATIVFSSSAPKRRPGGALVRFEQEKPAKFGTLAAAFPCIPGKTVLQ